MWLFLPLVLFYWALMPVQFAFVTPIKAFLGKIIDPMLSIANGFFDFSFLYQGLNISYAPLVLVGAVLIQIRDASLNDKILDLIENIIHKININRASQNQITRKNKEILQAQEELEKTKPYISC